MAQYTFIKNFGNKKAGESYPLLAGAAACLIKSGHVKPTDQDAEKPAKKGKK